MKTNHIYFATVLCFALLLSACSNNEPSIKQSDNIAIGITIQSESKTPTSRRYTTEIVDKTQKDWEKYCDEVNLMAFKAGSLKPEDKFFHQWCNRCTDKPDQWLFFGNSYGTDAHLSTSGYVQTIMWPDYHLDFYAVTHLEHTDTPKWIFYNGDGKNPYFEFHSYTGNFVTGQDLLYAVALDKYHDNDEKYRVPLVFKHAMSKIEFSFENKNPDVEIVIDNVNMFAYTEGTFDFDRTQSDDEAQITWRDHSNYKTLSYANGMDFMRAIVMHGADGKAYIPQISMDDPRPAFVDYYNERYSASLTVAERSEYPEEKKGTELYHLVVPQPVPVKTDNMTMTYDDGSHCPLIAIWVAIRNIHGENGKDKTPPANLVGDNYNKYPITKDEFKYIYDDRDVYGFTYVYIPLNNADGEGFDLLPGKTYRYKIVFEKGAGWGVDFKQTIVPVVTGISVSDFENVNDPITYTPSAPY